MLKLTVSKPNTIGTYINKEFEDYNAAENYIEHMVERLADAGWDVSELKGSDSKNGVIECTHDYEADIKLIEWKTVA